MEQNGNGLSLCKDDPEDERERDEKTVSLMNGHVEHQSVVERGNVDEEKQKLIQQQSTNPKRKWRLSKPQGTKIGSIGTKGNDIIFNSSSHELQDSSPQKSETPSPTFKGHLSQKRLSQKFPSQKHLSQNTSLSQSARSQSPAPVRARAQNTCSLPRPSKNTSPVSLSPTGFKTASPSYQFLHSPIKSPAKFIRNQAKAPVSPLRSRSPCQSNFRSNVAVGGLPVSKGEPIQRSPSFILGATKFSNSSGSEEGMIISPELSKKRQSTNIAAWSEARIPTPTRDISPTSNPSSPVSLILSLSTKRKRAYLVSSNSFSGLAKSQEKMAPLEQRQSLSTSHDDFEVGLSSSSKIDQTPVSQKKSSLRESESPPTPNEDKEVDFSNELSLDSPTTNQKNGHKRIRSSKFYVLPLRDDDMFHREEIKPLPDDEDFDGTRKGSRVAIVRRSVAKHVKEKAKRKRKSHLICEGLLHKGDPESANQSPNDTLNSNLEKNGKVIGLSKMRGMLFSFLKELKTVLASLVALKTQFHLPLSESNMLTEHDVQVIFGNIQELCATCKKCISIFSLVFASLKSKNEFDENFLPDFYQIFYPVCSGFLIYYENILYGVDRARTCARANKPFLDFLKIQLSSSVTQKVKTGLTSETDEFIRSLPMFEKIKPYVQEFLHRLYEPLKKIGTIRKFCTTIHDRYSDLKKEENKSDDKDINLEKEKEKEKERERDSKKRKGKERGKEKGKERGKEKEVKKILNRLSVLPPRFGRHFTDISLLRASLKGWDGLNGLLAKERLLLKEGEVIESGRILINGECTNAPIRLYLFSDLILFVNSKSNVVISCIYFPSLAVKQFVAKKRTISLKNDSLEQLNKFIQGGSAGGVTKTNIQIQFGSVSDARQWRLPIQRRVAVYRIFDLPLSVVVDFENRLLPSILALPIFMYYASMLKSEGIFRKGTSKDLVSRLQSLVDSRDPQLDLQKESKKNPHLIAEVFKIWLRSLPEPIVTWRLREELINSLRDHEPACDPPVQSSVLPFSFELDGSEEEEGEDDESDPEEEEEEDGLQQNLYQSQQSQFSPNQISELKQLIHQIPSPNIKVLRFLIGFLKTVVSFESENKMSAENVAIIFGPLILAPAPRSSSSSSSSQKGNRNLPFVPDVSGPTSVVGALLDHSLNLFGEECTADGWIRRYVSSSSPLSDDDDEDSDQIRGLDWYAKNL